MKNTWPTEHEILKEKVWFEAKQKIEILRKHDKMTQVKLFKANVLALRYLEWFGLSKNCLLVTGKWGKSRKTL